MQRLTKMDRGFLWARIRHLERSSRVPQKLFPIKNETLSNPPLFLRKSIQTPKTQNPNSAEEMPLQTSALALGSASSKLFTTGDSIAFCNNGSKSCPLNHINFSRNSHKSHCKRRCSVYASSRVSDTQHSGLVQDSAASAEALQDARRSADWKVAKAYSDSGLIYEGMVEGYNGGGLLIKFHSLVGFLPFPQLSPSHFCKERGKGLQDIAKGLPGSLISVKVIQADEENKKLIFSEKEAVWSKFSEQISVGDVFEARVGSMEDYGAFVHLRFPDGLYHLTGLVHVSEVSWDLVQDIRDILTEGDDVRVKIINIDREKSRITLSIKQLEEDPLLETLDKVIPQDGSVDPDSLSTSASTSSDIEPLPGLASILEELVQEDGIDDVRISRQGFEKRVVSQDLQLWLSNSPAINRKFTLLARAGRQVQEIQLTTTLDQEGIKKALQHVLERVP